MQRNNALGSRFNISSPQSNDGLNLMGGMSDGPYPSLRPPGQSWSGAGASDPRSSPSPSHSNTSLPPTRSPARRYGDLPPPSASPPSVRANGNGYGGSGHSRMPSDASTGPSRPARSQRRMEGNAPPPSQPHLLAPIRTNNLGRPDSQEMPSPISPEIPLVSTPMAEGEDPFAMDRLQRTQARKATLQTPNAALHTPSPASASVTPEERMRKAVAAFASNRKESHDSDQKTPVRRPPRRRGTTVSRPKDESWDDFYMGGGKFAEVDSVMKVIRKEWPFIMGAEFSPSTLALSLLSQQPSQTLGPHPDLYHFQDVHNGLSNALQKAVRGHFQTFAASLPTHTNFVSTLDRAQDQVKSSREALKQAKEGLAGKSKAELASVRARERMVREMLQVVDQIDELKQAPEQLETWIAEKKFLQAALLLVKSMKGINRESLQDIGALSDLKQYFQSQHNTLSDILIEELHNHLYLKSFNSESRWKAYTPGQSSVPVIDAHEDQPTAPDADHSRFSQFLSHLAVKPNHIPNLDEVTANGLTRERERVSLNMSRAPSMTSIASVGATVDTSGGETDSFTYMETLLEALAALGRLGSALDIMVQRVPSEIHQIVDSTMEEVEERIEQRASDLTNMLRPTTMLLADKNDLESMPLFDNDTLRVVVSLDATGPPENAIVLRDLFWTLYSKLAAVMEGHRAVYEVARWIASRRDFKDTTKADLNLNVPVLEIWRPVQQEVRTLLQAYLSDDSQGSALKNSALPSINEILREGRLVRDKQKELFRFGDTDARAVNSEIKEIDDSLKQTLRASVPGLVNLQAGDTGNVLGAVSGADERYSTSGKIRTLIPSNPFNVTVLFQPTISFIKRATDIVPSGFEDEMSQFGTVLEEFVENVFIPQLDEKVTASFQHAVTGYDAYQIDRRPIFGLEKPPLKSTVRVLALIQSLCAMLHESPFHRENYSRLVVGVIGQYYQQVNQHFKDVVTISRREDGSPKIGLPADWALNGELDVVLNQIRTIAPQDVREMDRLEQQEARVEMRLCGDTPPVESQLLNSSRKLEALAHIAQSVRWFMNSLLNLQELVDDDDIDKPSLQPQEGAPKLPLTRAMAQRFESIVQFYEQLVSMTLNTLHLEVRCRVLCNLSATLRRNDYRLESEALEPDPDVVDLNATLLEMDSIASKTLSLQDHRFMFKGLGNLIDNIFIQSARQLKHINGAGARKIRRNILSLQQTLRGINTTDVVLKSIEYWDLYELGPKQMLESIGGKPDFGFDDYNAMLSLQCQENGLDLNSHLIDLHALAMNIEDWEVV